MKKPAWIILCIITIVAGLALSATNLVTEEPINRQKLQASNAARIAVFPGADDFKSLTVEADSHMDSAYEALLSGATVGYVLQTTVSGYGGPIEIVMGVDTKGTITGLSVGGSNFAETAGLGTRTREPAFTNQFVGLNEPPVLKQNIDAVSGATISSTAVTNGANRCYLYWAKLAGVTVAAQPQGTETATDSATTGATAATGATVNNSNTADTTTAATAGGESNGAAGATATQAVATAAFPKPAATPDANAATGATVNNSNTANTSTAATAGGTNSGATGATATQAAATAAFPKPAATPDANAATGATVNNTNTADTTTAATEYAEDDD